MKPIVLATFAAAIWGLAYKAALGQPFSNPEFSTPFAAEGRLSTGGQAAYGQAIVGRIYTQRETEQAAAVLQQGNACGQRSQGPNSCKSPQGQSSTTSGLGNVTLEKWSSNFAPVVVNVKIK